MSESFEVLSDEVEPLFPQQIHYDRDWRAIELRFKEKRTYQDIANEFGVSATRAREIVLVAQQQLLQGQLVDTSELAMFDLRTRNALKVAGLLRGEDIRLATDNELVSIWQISKVKLATIRSVYPFKVHTRQCSSCGGKGEITVTNE